MPAQLLSWLMIGWLIYFFTSFLDAVFFIDLGDEGPVPADVRFFLEVRFPSSREGDA